MDAELMTVIQAGFTDISAMIVDIIKIAFPATIGVMVLAQGARYAMRWIRGLISKA